MPLKTIKLAPEVVLRQYLTTVFRFCFHTCSTIKAFYLETFPNNPTDQYLPWDKMASGGWTKCLSSYYQPITVSPSFLPLPRSTQYNISMVWCNNTAGSVAYWYGILAVCTGHYGDLEEILHDNLWIMTTKDSCASPAWCHHSGHRPKWSQGQKYNLVTFKIVTIKGKQNLSTKYMALNCVR